MKTCAFCGKPIMRYEVPYTDRSKPEPTYYHASCYAEKKIRDMQLSDMRQHNSAWP